MLCVLNLFWKYFYFNPALALISNILSMGNFALMRKSSFMNNSGSSYFKHKYIFSSVLSFMCGQSLQAQLLFGGAGMNVFWGDACIILCKIPVSVATMYSCDVSVWVYFNRPVVEPI